MHRSSRPTPLVWLVAIAAAALPPLLAKNISPSPTFWNQALAFGLWGLFVLVTAPALRRSDQRGTWPLQGALLLLALAATWSWLHGALPASLGLSALATLAAASLMVAAGAGSRCVGDDGARAGAGTQTDNDTRHDAHADTRTADPAPASPMLVAMLWGLAAAGALSLLVALVQVFLPDQCDGSWIACSGYPGRAVGNMRQPNHLSSLLMGSAIAVLALFELRRLGTALAAIAITGLMFGVVLTASRTGLVSVVLLALWGLADRRLSRPARLMLMAAPLAYALSWLLMAQWATLSHHAFGGSARLAETDISSSRFGIWRDTLKLIAQQPWTGVGFGEFNIAWTLTPSPHRPVAFFDHTHNLLLQFAVELGLPLAAVLTGLLAWALVAGFRRSWPMAGGAGAAQRSAMVMVLMIGVHSQLEYPLWYAYFLLPIAWLWGHVLGAPAASQPVVAGVPRGRSSLALQLCALALMAGTAFAVGDYARVARIFSADSDLPLAERIAAGRHSVFFAHHADYADVTTGAAEQVPPQRFDRVVHYLLDTRLMTAWAKSLAAHDRVDEARHLAARIREFHRPESAALFDACAAASPVEGAATSAPAASATVPTVPTVPTASGAGSASRFACQPPLAAHPWREFMAD